MDVEQILRSLGHERTSLSETSHVFPVDPLPGCPFCGGQLPVEIDIRAGEPVRLTFSSCCFAMRNRWIEAVALEAESRVRERKRLRRNRRR